MTSCPFWMLEIVNDSRSAESVTCGRLTFHEELPTTDHVTMAEVTAGKPAFVIVQLMVTEDPSTPTTVPFVEEIIGLTGQRERERERERERKEWRERWGRLVEVLQGERERSEREGQNLRPKVSKEGAQSRRGGHASSTLDLKNLSACVCGCFGGAP